MHVFAYEYLSSGAAGDASVRSSLHTEGWAMLSALLEDLVRCPRVQVSTLLDCQPVAEKDAFCELAAAADWSLLIAPEFDGILAQRSRWVEEAGGRLMGSSPQAIQQTADKLLLSKFWSERGIATPPEERTYPLVCKPRFGAGSQATFLVRDEEELARAVLQAGAEGWSSPLILQRYVPGLAASVAFLCGDGKRQGLPAVEQRLSHDGRFRYLGGRLPLPDHLDRRARRLAERAVEGIDGLRGWFGVDLILGAAADGSGDAAIEINPRLTTSYLGLRRLARFNLAEALLALATDSSIPRWEWKRGVDLSFRAKR